MVSGFQSKHVRLISASGWITMSNYQSKPLYEWDIYNGEAYAYERDVGRNVTGDILRYGSTPGFVIGNTGQTFSVGLSALGILTDAIYIAGTITNAIYVNFAGTITNFITFDAPTNSTYFLKASAYGGCVENTGSVGALIARLTVLVGAVPLVIPLYAPS